MPEKLWILRGLNRTNIQDFFIFFLFCEWGLEGMGGAGGGRVRTGKDRRKCWQEWKPLFLFIIMTSLLFSG